MLAFCLSLSVLIQKIPCYITYATKLYNFAQTSEMRRMVELNEDCPTHHGKVVTPSSHCSAVKTVKWDVLAKQL